MQDHFDRDTKSISWNYYDFPSMTASDKLWKTASKHINVMMFNSTHVTEGFGANGVPSLPLVRAMLEAHKIKAGGGGGVIYTDGVCNGAGIEGMSSDKGFAREAYYTTKTWHDAGLPMDYFVMDGPFGFGFTGTHATCNFSIKEVAQRAATTMSKIRELYPKIIVIDAEGPGKELPEEWLPKYHQFLDAFKTAYGAPIDFLDMDLHWNDAWNTGYTWVSAAKEIAEDMHRNGLRVGLIVDAEDSAEDPSLKQPKPFNMTANYWMRAVRMHVDMIKKNSIPLDAVDFESWMNFPRKNLPEADPLAWTSIVTYAYRELLAQ